MKTVVKSSFVLAMVAGLAISTGCSRTQKTLGGAAIGGAGGAVVGNAVGGSTGAVVGGVSGAVVGGVVGRNY
ncbi:YMGG-like glycine zipper-containing protein [Jiella mangrovi]|nr:YMGG-like glycine zipper-containing protein [Jiella mangrovi]